MLAPVGLAATDLSLAGPPELALARSISCTGERPTWRPTFGPAKFELMANGKFVSLGSITIEQGARWQPNGSDQPSFVQVGGFKALAIAR